MIAQETSPVQQVIDWYGSLVRPLLKELEPGRLAEFDRHCKRLQELTTNPEPEFSACFLGKSGVGKSTLINALVADNAIVLPTGGIGPLTALAIEVRYSETPYFLVQYHGRQQLQQVILPLEQLAERRRKTAADAELVTAPAQSDDNADEGNERAHRERQANLLVKGDQFCAAPLDYLVDCLRAARSGDPSLLEKADPEDRRRLERIHEAVSLGQKEFTRGSDQAVFLTELREHAAGFLSPLIKEGKLGWPSELLKGGMVLVDLPGVGIANDAYRAVTASWVRDRAQTICLIVDKSGVDSDSARMLSDANFLNRLIHRGTEREIDPVQILVGVVKMDQNVEEKLTEAEQSNPDGDCSYRDFLPSLFGAIPATIKGQLRSKLEEEFRQEGKAGEAQQEAVEAVLSEVQVHPLMAIQYRRLMGGKQRPFIESTEETGVPQLRESLLRHFAEFRELGAARHVNTAGHYAAQLASILRAHEQEIENSEIETADVEQLREALVAQQPIWTRTLDKHDLAFREFLQSTVPALIGELVAAASHAAERDMHRYVDQLADAHFKFLQASVRRGNVVYVGSTMSIDLPAKFGEFLDNQIAPRWRQEVLKPLRERAAALSREYVRLVEEVINWAEAHEARTQARAVGALRDQIQADADAFVLAAKDSAETLRLQVKDRLMKEIVKPIRRRCDKFLVDGDNQGRGVKDRILKMFHELVGKVIDGATEPTRRFLEKTYDAASEEMLQSFKEYPDPVRIACERIVSVHMDSERRAQLQQRSRELRRIRAAMETAPALENRQ